MPPCRDADTGRRHHRGETAMTIKPKYAVIRYQPEDGDGWLRFYDPAMGERLEPYSEVSSSRRAVEERTQEAEARARALREELRRLRGR